jgi:hypothetical protein
MVFVEGDNYRALRRPGDDPAQFRAPVRLPRRQAVGLDAAITDGLVAWYRFEDAANTAIDATNALGVGANQTAFDGTVNGASFVENGGVRDVVSGANSGAYDFDGVDDNITASNVPHSTGTTIMCSLRNGGNSDRGRVIRQFSSGNKNNSLRVNGTDLFVESANRELSLSSVAPVGERVHFAGVIPNDTSKPMKGFVDGVLVGEDNLNTTYSTVTGQFAIGSDVNGTNFFHGQPDDVRLYNRALSASEINQIYQNTDPDQ